MKKFIAIFIALVFCIVPCSSLVLSAAQPSTGSDVLDDTRYSAIGFGTVFDIIEFASDLIEGEIDYNDIGILPYEDIIEKFASEVAKNAYTDTFDLNRYAIESTQGYQIKDIYAMMAKRKIVYPVGGYEETQYLYVYQNLNAGASPQQFGDYTIAPNTLFMLRQTNFSGVLAYSIPLAENNINLSFGNSSKPLGIVLPANQNFKMYTESGTESFVLPQGVTVFVQNNSINSIVNDHLQAVYDYDISHNRNYYEDFLPDGYMDGLEALMGVGITYSYSDWTTDWSGYGGDGTNQNPWYVTGFFSNTDVGTGSPSYYSTNININPALPPGYILSPDNPLHSGKVINNETINNYNDYGVTMVNGSLEIDPDILAAALGALIDPDFGAAVQGVYSAQPEIGLDFNTPLDLNLPDLVDDYLQSITVYPPSDGWEPPSYPAVNTSTYIPASVPSYETYALQTIPDEYIEGTGDWFFFGYDLLDSLGLLVFVIPLVILGLFWRFTGGD